MNEREWMLTSLLNCRRVDLAVDAPTLTADEEKRLSYMEDRLKNGEPLQYITGKCDFMGIILKVDERVLIPRPETEILVELAIERVKNFSRVEMIKILDLGTGSGNIAIALAGYIARACVTALDVSKEALELATLNAKNYGVYDKIEFVHADMGRFLETFGQSEEKFDVIISNPPYVPNVMMGLLPSNVRCEPALALDGGEEGLKFYREIIQSAHGCLKDRGMIFMEIGDGQRETIEKIFNDHPYYGAVGFHQDYAHIDRIIYAQRDLNINNNR